MRVKERLLSLIRPNIAKEDAAITEGQASAFRDQLKNRFDELNELEKGKKLTCDIEVATEDTPECAGDRRPSIAASRYGIFKLEWKDNVVIFPTGLNAAGAVRKEIDSKDYMLYGPIALLKLQKAIAIQKA